MIFRRKPHKQEVTMEDFRRLVDQQDHRYDRIMLILQRMCGGGSQVAKPEESTTTPTRETDTTASSNSLSKLGEVLVGLDTLISTATRCKEVLQLNFKLDQVGDSGRGVVVSLDCDEDEPHPHIHHFVPATGPKWLPNPHGVYVGRCLVCGILQKVDVPNA